MLSVFRLVPVTITICFGIVLPGPVAAAPASWHTYSVSLDDPSSSAVYPSRSAARFGRTHVTARILSENVTSPGSFWPYPLAVSEGSGQCFTIASNFSITSKGFGSPVLLAAITRYGTINFAYGSNNDMNSSPYPHVIQSMDVSVQTSDVALRIGVDESYHLIIQHPTAKITANTVYGALRGLETFSQAVQRNFTTPPNLGFYYACHQNVTDAPRFPYRGLLVDTSRHYMSVTSIKSVMDLMSYTKMNALHLHLTDDQSWPIVIPAFPLLAEVGAYSRFHTYTAAQLKELVEYGINRGIVIIPEIDTPSHSSQLVKAYPDIGCLAYDSNNNPFRCLVDLANPSLFTFMKTLWGTLDAIFPKEYPFFIGGDEVWFGCWETCNSTAAFMNASGWDVRDAYNWYELELVKTLSSFNRTLIAWEDIVGFANGSFTQNGLSNVWMEQWDGSPDVWNWDTCDLLAANATVVIAGPYSILSSSQTNYGADLFNLTCPPTPYQQSLIAGPELMLWDDAQDTDGGDLIVDAMQALLAIGETSWSPQSVTHGALINSSRYQDMRCRLLSRLVQSHPWLPTGSFCTPEYPGLLAPWSE